MTFTLRTAQGSPNLLIVFSRYPVPGRTKTRLIPRLGTAGAAALQEAMTGQTILEARNGAADTACRIEVRYTGAGAGRMKRWLGAGLGVPEARLARWYYGTGKGPQDAA